jgi:hypothetical protein
MADKILEKIDENRRGFVKRLLGVSFAAPLIATFSLAALSPNTAKAVTITNQSCEGSTRNTLFRDGFWDGATSPEACDQVDGSAV